MRRLGALITAAVVAATMPTAASAVAVGFVERVTLTGLDESQNILLRFNNYGNNVAAAGANAFIIGSAGDLFISGLTGWTITANSFDISSTGQVTAATFGLVSQDGLRTLSFNVNGVNQLVGPALPDPRFGGDPEPYNYSDNNGFAGLAFKFASGTLVSGPSTGFLPTAAVPESATWVMMIGGFGLVGGAMRRRRSAAALAAA